MSTAVNREDASADEDDVAVGEHGLLVDIARAVAEHDERLRAAMQQHLQRRD